MSIEPRARVAIFAQKPPESFLEKIRGRYSAFCGRRSTYRVVELGGENVRMGRVLTFTLPDGLALVFRQGVRVHTRTKAELNNALRRAHAMIVPGDNMTIQFPRRSNRIVASMVCGEGVLPKIVEQFIRFHPGEIVIKPYAHGTIQSEQSNGPGAIRVTRDVSEVFINSSTHSIVFENASVEPVRREPVRSQIVHYTPERTELL